MTYQTFNKESSESAPRTWKELFYKYCCCCCARYTKANNSETVTIRVRSRIKVSDKEDIEQSSGRNKRRYGRYFEY